METKITKEQQKEFETEFEEFYKKCLNKNIVPMPMIGKGMASIYAYIGFIVVDNKRKQELLNNFSQK